MHARPRTAAEHAFADEAHAPARRAAARARARLLQPPRDRPTVRRRRTPDADCSRLDLPPDAEAYLCGPAAFMDDMRHALAALGIAADRIHTELFGALAAINPGLTGQPAGRRTSRPARRAPGRW